MVAFAGSLATLTYALLAVVPSAALFFFAYGRYDGLFKDNVVFLYFIGGLLVGGLLGLLSLLVLGTVALLTVILLAILYPITMVLGLNRRKWQGERHAVFNGGGLGLGAAVMLALSFLYRQILSLQAEVIAAQGIVKLPDGTFRKSDQALIDDYVLAHVYTFAGIGQALLLAAALAGFFFGLGLLAGDAVRRRKAIPTALMGAAITLPFIIILQQFVADRDWLFLGLLVAYGAIFAFFAEKRLFLEGVEEDARKQLRRRRRKTVP